MKLIGRVEATYYGCYVRLGGRDVQLAGTRPPAGWLITVTTPDDVTGVGELVRWLGATAGLIQISPRHWRGTQLVDFLDAGQADAYIGSVRQRYIPELFAQFASEGAAWLRAAISEALELDGAARAAAAHRLAGAVRRYTVILDVPEAPPVLEEIRRQPDVELLMALDNAVVHWARQPIAPPDRSAIAAASSVLADEADPGLSVPWHRWLWQLARATTRAELTAIVDAVLADVDRRTAKSKKKQVVEDRAEARRLATRMRAAVVEQLAIDPPRTDLFTAPMMRDEDVFHYVAFMALTHAAYALARGEGEVESVAEANLAATRAIAELALAVLAHVTLPE